MPILKNLVVSGGGILGFLYLGAIAYLDERKLLENVNHYIGTSIGSMYCLCLVVGYKPYELFEFKKHLEINRVFDEVNLDNFIENFGFLKGSNRISYILKRLLENKKIKDSITFKDLYNLTNKKLTIVGVCLNDSSVHLFNHEETPNMQVLLAVRISINVPILFPPIEYDNKLWIDGGAVLNCPMEICKDEIENTIGICTNDRFVNTSDLKEHFAYISNLLCCLVTGNTKIVLKKYKNNIISINKYNDNFIDADIDERIAMFNHGYNFCKNSNILYRFLKEVSVIKANIFENLDYNSETETSDEISEIDLDG